MSRGGGGRRLQSGTGEGAAEGVDPADRRTGGRGAAAHPPAPVYPGENWGKPGGGGYIRPVPFSSRTGAGAVHPSVFTLGL
jgi:hypothetical protein